MEFCGCHQDFMKILYQINQEYEEKMLPLNEGSLSKNQGTQYKYHTDYKKYMEASYLEFYQELEERDPNELLTYELPFELQDRFIAAFGGFKKKFHPIIAKIHVILASGVSVTKILNEDMLNKFEIDNF